MRLESCVWQLSTASPYTQLGPIRMTRLQTHGKAKVAMRLQQHLHHTFRDINACHFQGTKNIMTCSNRMLIITHLIPLTYDSVINLTHVVFLKKSRDVIATMNVLCFSSSTIDSPAVFPFSATNIFLDRNSRLLREGSLGRLEVENFGVLVAMLKSEAQQKWRPMVRISKPFGFLPAAIVG